MSTKKRGLGCLFYIVSILFVIFTSVFGFSLNSTKQFSQLLAGSYFEKNQFFTHTEIIDCQAEYDELLNISRSLYGQKRKINSYVLTRDFYSFNISGYNYSFKICAVPNYSDRQEMECLSIPLYLDNSSIGTGPVHDATYASYIPSSFADYLIEKGLFSSFEDILKSKLILNYFNNVSFSINNIYLNNLSVHWKNTNDFKTSTFFNHYSEWNPDAIFAYCPSILRNDASISFFADVRKGFGNLKVLFDSIGKNLEKEATLKMYKNDDGKTYIINNISIKNSVNTFGIFQIIFIVLVFVFLFLFIWLAYLCFLNHLISGFYIITCVSISLLLLCELTKSFLSTSQLLFVIFNRYFNSALLIVSAISIFIILLLLKKRKNEIKSEIYSVSI